MKVYLRFLSRDSQRHFTQSALVVLGVAVGVAVIIAIDIANSSAQRAFAFTTRSLRGQATHQIQGGPSGLPLSLYVDLRKSLGVSRVAPIITGYLRSPELGDSPLQLLGVDPFAEAPFRNYLRGLPVADDRGDFADLQTFLLEPDALYLSAALAERFGVELGDAIWLESGSSTRRMRILGLLTAQDAFSTATLENLLLVDIATAQELVGAPGRLSRIDLIIDEASGLSPIESILPPGTSLTSTVQAESALGQLTAAFRTNLSAFSLLALIVGAFLIFNTISFSIVQRRELLGILRALGATGEQLFAIFLGEALVLGVLGCVLGVGLGLIFGRFTVDYVTQAITDLYFTIQVSGIILDGATLARGILVGMLVSAVAAALPALKASRTPPIQSLRRSQGEEVANRVAGQLFLLGGGLWLAAYGLLRGLDIGASLELGFVALTGFILGGAFFAPALMVLIMRLSGPLQERLFGFYGRLAPRLVMRALSRTGLAVAALTVSVSVIIGISSMIGSFRLSVIEWLEQSLRAEIYLASPTLGTNQPALNVDPAFLARVRQLPGVEWITHNRVMRVLDADRPESPALTINAASGDVARGGRILRWSTLVEPEQYWTALEEGALMVSEALANRLNLAPPNNQLTLETERGPQNFPIVAAYADFSSDAGALLMARSVYDRYFDDPYISTVAIFLAKDADAAAISRELAQEILPGTGLSLRSFGELRDDALRTFDQVFAITLALRYLATLVSFIGIVAAMLSLQLENASSYGVMRALGMTPRQLWLLTFAQTGTMGWFAGVLAIPIGALIALLLVDVINLRSFGYSIPFEFPPTVWLGAFATALLAALSAAIGPAWQLSRLETATVIRAE